MHPILLKLAGGDRRSTGAADEVATEIAADPALFEAVFEGMLAQDPVVRMRAADAVEKATRGRPELLRPFQAALLRAVAASEQQEVRWHAAQMLPRLALDAPERAAAVAVLEGYLRDKSRIVQANALGALADLAQQDDHLRSRVVSLLEAVVGSDSAAVRARARRLLAEIG